MSPIVQKKLKMSLFSQIVFFNVKNQKFIKLKVISGKELFLRLPFYVVIKKSKDFLSISLFENSMLYQKLFTNFCSSIENFLNFESKIYRKTLILKGAGYSSNLSECGSKIIFNLGFSHLITVDFANKDIKLSSKKNSIVIEGTDKVLVGDFANQIRNLKLPDSYKGKGFWYKNEVRVLKEIKKS